MFLGESKVGKTSILNLYKDGKINPDIQPSLTSVFFRKEVNLTE